MPEITSTTNLTKRETQILTLIADGHSNTQIGKLLEISHRTVDTHRTNIRNKLGVNGLAGMIKYALQSNLIE